MVVLFMKDIDINQQCYRSCALWLTRIRFRLARQSILTGLGLVNCLSSSCSHYRNR